MMVCGICKRITRDYGMPCMPTSCQCICHRKSKAAIDKVTGNMEIINARIAKETKRGVGLVHPGTKFKYNTRQDERR